MEEFVTLYYGNFSILGERAKEFAWHTSCSNQFADRTLWSQIFLDKLKREHLGWTTTHRQEWGLFLLEHLLHNVDSMRKKECQRHFQRLQAEARWRDDPWTSLHDNPHRYHWWHHSQSGWTNLLRRWTLAPSILFCQQHDDHMRELNRCMSRAHHSLTLEKALNRVTPPPEELGLKSQPSHLLPYPDQGQRDQIL